MWANHLSGSHEEKHSHCALCEEYVCRTKTQNKNSSEALSSILLVKMLLPYYEMARVVSLEVIHMIRHLVFPIKWCVAFWFIKSNTVLSFSWNQKKIIHQWNSVTVWDSHNKHHHHYRVSFYLHRPCVPPQTYAFLGATEFCAQLWNVPSGEDTALRFFTW